MRVNQRVNLSYFTGSPLYVKMIARAYELYTDTWLRLGFFGLSGEIDFVCLYHNFFERKLCIYPAKADGPDITNHSILDCHDRLREFFWKFWRSVL